MVCKLEKIVRRALWILWWSNKRCTSSQITLQYNTLHYKLSFRWLHAQGSTVRSHLFYSATHHCWLNSSICQDLFFQRNTQAKWSFILNLTQCWNLNLWCFDHTDCALANTATDLHFLAGQLRRDKISQHVARSDKIQQHVARSDKR